MKYKSQYLNDLFEKTKKTYEGEKEFLNAVEEFFDSLDFLLPKHPEIENNGILERLIVPERVLSFRVSWVDDQGKVQVNHGYRVQFNSAIGPYKGGLRFHPSVNLSILKFLGFEQIFKNSLTGLPMGGGKGGSDFDPKGKSDGEVMRFCQAFMDCLYPFIGPDTDVPAGDLGVGGREIGYLYGEYKKLTHRADGALTGKGLSFGGSLIRPEATGYGLVYFVEEMLKSYFPGKTLQGSKVAISGKGNVATYAMEKATKLGATVVSLSDTSGYIYCEKGINVPSLLPFILAKKGSLKDYANEHSEVLFKEDNRAMWRDAKCDIALPCATQNEIGLEEIKALKEHGCFLLAEGANMPTELAAIRYCNENGILFAPGKASNAGGVSVSGLEMSQNALHLSWSKEEVDQKLHDIMVNIFQSCRKTAEEYGQPNNLALGANLAGFWKVYQAMLAQGVI